MKNLFTLLLAVMAIFPVFSQENTPDKPPVTGFLKAFETIMSDFPYNYRHITGDLIQVENDFEQFTSAVIPEGAETCIIGFYHSALDTTASWQAKMFHGETFEQTAKEYKRLYNQLNRCKLKMVDGSLFDIEGEYETPSEEKAFLISELKAQTADERYRDFKIELEMLYKIDQWVININVISRKKDSEMHPDWMEGR